MFQREIKLYPCAIEGAGNSMIYCWMPKPQLEKKNKKKADLFNYLLRKHGHTCCLIKRPAFEQFLPVGRANRAISNESAVH